VQHELDTTLARLRDESSDALSTLVAAVRQSRPTLLERVSRAASAAPVGLKTRLHGDLHLGQVLLRRDDFVIIDFEGEPQRTLAERRAKHSALRDVAGMLRSFDYARHNALSKVAKTPPELERLAPVAQAWGQQVRDAFLSAYHEVALAGGLYADDAAYAAALETLALFEIEKALYELRYELDNRPDWVGVPLAGLAALAGLTTRIGLGA
jgi:maltose alpha-D-glucosyltransferase/alpha-amylase